MTCGLVINAHIYVWSIFHIFIFVSEPLKTSVRGIFFPVSEHPIGFNHAMAAIDLSVQFWIKRNLDLCCRDQNLVKWPLPWCAGPLCAGASTANPGCLALQSGCDVEGLWVPPNTPLDNPLQGCHQVLPQREAAVYKSHSTPQASTLHPKNTHHLCVSCRYHFEGWRYLIKSVMKKIAHAMNMNEILKSTRK